LAVNSSKDVSHGPPYAQNPKLNFNIGPSNSQNGDYGILNGKMHG